MKGYIDMAIRKKIIKRGVSEEVLAELDADMAEYIKARNTREEAEERRKELGEKILATLKDHDLDTYKGVNGKVTVSEGVNTVLDETKLKRRIGNALWTKISDRRVNSAKLEAFIKAGDIKSADVVACSTETPRTPYVTVTAK